MNTLVKTSLSPRETKYEIWVHEDEIKVNQALINQYHTKTIKNQEDKSDDRKRASISRGEINTLVYISF